MNLFNNAKKAVALFAVVALMVMMVPAVKAATIMDGDLIKSADSSALYMVSGATKRVFPHANVYLSWGYPSDFSTVKTVSAADLASYTDGDAVPFRDGSLFRGTTSSLYGKDASAVFVVSNGKLMPIQSAEVYQALYNDASWNKVTWVPADMLSKFSYPLGDTVVSSATHPDGALIRYAGSDSVYLIKDGQKRLVSDAGFAANRYQVANIISVPTTEVYADGAAVIATETALVVPAAWTSTTPSVGSTLTVSLASDTPAAATVLADSTGEGTDGAQAMIPFVKVNFTAPASGAVTVNTLKFTRGGISSDTDLSSMYLYEGTAKLADYNSFTNKLVSFTKAGGLFTVPAGTTKTITLMGDLLNNTSSGKTISFSLESANVTTDGATVTGSAAGKLMSTATVSDLGKLTIDDGTPPTSLDPGVTNQEVWSFTLNPDSQDIKIEKVRLTMIGTASVTDLANFNLYEGATLLGSVAAMDSDKSITFSNLNYTMTKSATNKTFSLKADVVSGTRRSFYFSIENMDDVKVMDVNYGVYIKPNQADTWTIIKAATSTDINFGTLTITKSTSSPTGNVADNGTDITLAKFDFKASGEDIKITSLPVGMELTNATTIDNVKLLVDGTQVGTTDTSVADYDDTVGNLATFSLGNSFIVPAGTTKVLSIIGDIEGTNMGEADTITAKLATGSGNARGMSSSTSIDTTASAGNTLTVATGTLTVAKNIALAEQTASYPTGVAGTTNVKIASFVMTSGSAEGAKISQIVVRDVNTATPFLGTKYQNLVLKHGSTQIGNTIGSLTAAATSYAFTPANTINLAASESYVVDVYADIKSGVTLAEDAMVKMFSISYTTAVTAESSTWDGVTGVVGQTNCIVDVGDLRVSKDSSSISAKQLVMGTTNQELGTFKLQQYNGAEAMNISKIIITDTTTAPGEISDVKVYDGTTLLGTVPTLTPDDDDTPTKGTATFNLASELVIPKGGYKLLTVKADVTAYQGNSTSAHTHVVSLANTDSLVVRGASSSTSVTIVDVDGTTYGTVPTANTHYVYRTKPTFTLNSTSPSGTAVGSVSQTLIKVDVSADAANDVIIESIAFTVSSNEATLIANGKDYKLYDWNDAQLGSTADLTSGVATFGSLTLTIPAGTTKTIYVKGDTSTAVDTDSLQVYINASEDITWHDGIASETNSALNKTIPLYGGTFSY